MGENEGRSFRIKSGACKYWLAQLKVELLNTGSHFVDFQNLIDFLKAVLSEHWQTLHDLGRRSENSTKETE